MTQANEPIQSDWGDVLERAGQGAAQAWYDRQKTEQKRLDAREERIAFIEADPRYKAINDLVEHLEKAKATADKNFDDAKKLLQATVGEAYAAGHSEEKTMLDGLVTAVVTESAVVHWDEQIALQWGIKVLREHPELIAKMFKPDKAGFKALAGDPAALERLGLLAIPSEVMQIKTSYSGRINKGSENRFLDMLPVQQPEPEVEPVQPSTLIAKPAEVGDEVLIELGDEVYRARKVDAPEPPAPEQAPMFEDGMDTDDAADRHAAMKRIRAQDAVRDMGREPTDDIPF